jgi:F-type H+-transporting ATPase subunit b
MSLDFTFLGEIFTFLLLIVFTMKFVWPHLITAIETREKMVTDAEYQVANAKVLAGKASEDALKILSEARLSAGNIINDAERYAVQLKTEAQFEAQKHINEAKSLAKIAIEQERSLMHKQLKNDVAKLVLTATESLLSSEVTQEYKSQLLEKINLS